MSNRTDSLDELYNTLYYVEPESVGQSGGGSLDELYNHPRNDAPSVGSLDELYNHPRNDAPSVGSGFDLDGVLDKVRTLAGSLGLTNKDKSYDWGKILGLGAAGLTAYDTLNQPSRPVKSAAELLAGIPSNTPAGFSPEALAAMRVPMLAGNQMQGTYAADTPSPIRAGVRGYADGGEVDGPLSQVFSGVGYVGQGPGGGQDDLIEARLSPGEYVFDAESVAMLGDGDNAAGARKLDELREAMRAHKRSAPDDEIAPRALGPLSYMNGGSNA